MFSSNTDSLGYQSFKGASWVLVLGLYLGDTIKGLTLVLGPLFNPDIWPYVLGLHAYYFIPHQVHSNLDPIGPRKFVKVKPCFQAVSNTVLVSWYSLRYFGHKLSFTHPN